MVVLKGWSVKTLSVSRGWGLWSSSQQPCLKHFHSLLPWMLYNARLGCDNSYNVVTGVRAPIFKNMKTVLSLNLSSSAPILFLSLSLSSPHWGQDWDIQATMLAHLQTNNLNICSTLFNVEGETLICISKNILEKQIHTVIHFNWLTRV